MTLKNNPQEKSLVIFIAAGEPSGDFLGGKLMEALKEQTGGRVTFVGVGGEEMTKQGLSSLFDMGEVAVMGLTEVLPRARQILRRVRQAVDLAVKSKPDAVITIDSWGFSTRIQKGVKRRAPHIPRIHYVAPMVWAWREKRSKKLAGLVDHLMTLLPFEPEWFIREKLPATHVGHPVLEIAPEDYDGKLFRQRHELPSDVPLIAVLPGSRGAEVKKMLPVLLDAVTLLRVPFPDLQVVIPTRETVEYDIRKAVRNHDFRCIVVRDEAEKYSAFAAADAAMAVSGTVALELSRFGVPHVVGYQVSPVSAWLGRQLIRIPFMNLVNLVLGRMEVPELLQKEFNAQNFARHVKKFLEHGEESARQKAECARAIKMLAGGAQSPARTAADTVMKVIEYHRAPSTRAPERAQGNLKQEN